ncbi:MAG: hypothetical protein MJZ05_11740 [Fibrobacter sp.]|nr:hypothetical protein [Fibrobacter sp.]
MKNKILLISILFMSSISFAKNESDIKITVDCVENDSLKISISNHGDMTTCFHVPDEVDSFYDKNVVRFIPKFENNLAHMEGRPFSIECLSPYNKNALEQEYKRSYIVKNVFDKNIANIRGFYFSVGLFEKFKFLKIPGQKDYKEQVNFLTKNNTWFVRPCRSTK